MNDLEKRQLQSSPDPLIRELTAAGAKFKGKVCACVFCDDKNPSAGIYEKNGRWGYKCHKCGVGGDIFDIMAKVQGKSVGDILKGLGDGKPVMRQPAKPADDDDFPTITAPVKAPTTFASLEDAKARLSHLVASHVYSCPCSRRPEMYVFRLKPPGEHKRFLQGSPGPNGSIILKAPEKPWPIYNRARVAQATHIIVVEGEKAVHAIEDVLRALKITDIAATTSPGGAGKGGYANWTPLCGKHVYLWPDNDPANDKGDRTGINHMREIQKILEGLDPAPLLYWINPDDLDLPPKGDAFEFCAQYSDDKLRLEHLRAVLSLSDSLGASAGIKARFDDIASGKRYTVPLPWKELHEATLALRAGTVTLLCGDPGVAKSLCLLQLCQYWHFDLGHRLAIYELEDSREDHLTRLLAQRTGEFGLLSDEWVKNNLDFAYKARQEHQDIVDRLGRVIYEAPDKAVTLLALAEWIEDRAKAGSRIICIDPITAAQVGRESWIEDHAFLTSVKKSIVDHQCSLVIVTHPKKGRGRLSGLDDLAGGAAWQRLSHTILWLKNPTQKEKDCTLSTPLGTCAPQDKVDRVMAVLKARNGPGTGRDIAMGFRGLKLTELGSISKENK